jgi:membrane-associated HD superfamily phosphohydrolase
MTLKLCSLAAAVALAFATAAQAQTTRDSAPAPRSAADKVLDRPATGDRKVKKAEEDRVEADYKAAKNACDSMKGNDKEVCEVDAKGKMKVAKAELEAKYEPSVSHDRKVEEAKAEHKYEVAKEKCDAMKGKEESACEKQAKAEHDRAKADIRKQFANRKDERPARSASTGMTK